MKKISSKKLQLRGSTIALLAGPGLRIAQGGTNDGIGGGTGPACAAPDPTNTEGAGVNSYLDNNGKHQPCNITESVGCTVGCTVGCPIVTPTVGC